MTALGQAAQAYAASGWPVFPVYGIRNGACTCGQGYECTAAGKHPLTRRGFKEATRDRETILAWWGRWPEANIAVPTGAPSGLLVLDVDGPEGQRSIHDRELPQTLTARTGRGTHYYFVAPDPCPGSPTAIFPGVDVRGAGGYVVVPPSRHRFGDRYQWADHASPRVKTPAACPSWLLELLTKPACGRSSRSSREWAHLTAEGVAEGERHSTLVSLAGKVFGSNLDEGVGYHLLHAWNLSKCRPPLPHDETDAAIRDIAKKEAQKASKAGR